MTTLALILAVAGIAHAADAPKSWASDNGNGTYSNPLFYDEFSDPDMIRVGADYYLTGTTMHAMPGLPILHSRDLVNWRWIAYAFDRLDLGPDFRLEGGKEIYGQGIWAPSFRYYKGIYYIFANVNRFGLQVFRASDPRGPWKHTRIEKALHDLSVLFDDDGKIYAIYGARTIRIVELNADCTALIDGTDRVLIGQEQGMGEGSHVYKLNGRYYIVSAVPGAHVPMKCARAGKITGPWEVKTISENESLGIGQSYRLRGRPSAPPFEITPPNPAEGASLTLHQGGIIDTVTGEWWGFSMQDHNSVGRNTSLSPVTWVDGWPHFGLPGNLTRTPSLWVKPNTGHTEPVTSPYDRSDDFAKPNLQPVWQWNHLPDDAKWSLTERPGYLRLHSLPAAEFWWARNSLTQRSIGPESMATTELDSAGMKPGDVAGLALLNLPYAWIGIRREADGFTLEHYDQATGKSVRERVTQQRVQLRVHCDFDTDMAQFSYKTKAGAAFKAVGGELRMPFQLKTFQGVRYALFHYNTGGSPGGQADFDSFIVEEPRPRGLTRPIPIGQRVVFESLANGNVLALVDGRLHSVASAPTAFKVVDRGRGRIALQTESGRYLSADGTGIGVTAAQPGDGETFQWVDLQRGDTLLLSLATHRYVVAPKISGPADADHPGPAPDRKDGSCFQWKVAK